MPKHLSRWTLAELKQYGREHRPLCITRHHRTGRFNKRSYYDAVKRSIKINRPSQLRKLKLERLKERVRRENIPLPEDGSGRRGGLINKDYIMAIKKFYEPEEELAFDEPLMDGGRHLRQWNMTVPIGHSKEKDVSIFFKVSR